MEKKSAFDIIVSDLMHDMGSTELLEESMSLDLGRVSKVPLRYRIIALGFVRNYSLEEVNAKLTEAGCARLYARSLWEASLIFAFMHRLSYEEWKKLHEICNDFLKEKEVESPYFRSGKISLKELAEYIKENSDAAEAGFATKHLTRMIEKRLETTEPGEQMFRDFLISNMEAFTTVREKTRYYFCKYLYFMLQARIARYLDGVEAGDSEDLEAELVVFKGISELKRKKFTCGEAREILEQADISCGGIFDEFNYFYFEYISLDWMEVLLEYYGNVRSLPASKKTTLAQSLRKYDPKMYDSESDEAVLETLAGQMEKEEKELDEIYSLEGSSRGYQRNRSGENTIRKYIKGSLDIDRTTLVCFLLFFNSELQDLALNEDLLSEVECITEFRLDQILTECGFPGLRKDDDFDLFVIRYLSSDDPETYLMEEVTNYALMEENFYLYRVYQSSVSYHSEFEKLTK